MIHEGKSLHRPAPRRSYRRFLIACTAMAMALPLLPAVTEAQPCIGDADCSCTPSSESTLYPVGDSDGFGFATPQEECEYLKLIGYAEPDVAIPAVGYLGIDYKHNGCVRGRRSLSQKSLAKGWRAWGTPDDISVSGPGAHAVMAWTKKDADGKTFAIINLYINGIYRTSGMPFSNLESYGEIDHLTFCRIEGRAIAVPPQFPDGPACCGKPFPKIPGEQCTYKRQRLPGRQCRGAN